MKDQRMIIKKMMMYGEMMAYPSCSNSKQYCKDAGKKAMTMSEVELLRKLGIDIEVIEL